MSPLIKGMQEEDCLLLGLNPLSSNTSALGLHSAQNSNSKRLYLITGNHERNLMYFVCKTLLVNRTTHPNICLNLTKLQQFINIIPVTTRVQYDEGQVHLPMGHQGRHFRNSHICHFGSHRLLTYPVF